MQITAKKAEINNIVSHFPEPVLDDILTYLMEIQKRLNKKEKTDEILNKIFTEDNNLLQRLAK
ncbi:MAG: hypothetical protein CR988_04395 [Treponema sp.]|nr:MAG: hypothetical protein CR988_04395 [Treponema sp.]